METKATRNRFLKGVGVTLAAALGAAAYPAIARAALQCCPSDEAHCPGCQSPTPVPYHCSCPTGGYCTCRANNSGCFPSAC